MRQLAIVCTSLALLLGACVSSSPGPTDDIADDPGVKADSATYPQGAYELNEATGNQLAEVILMPDKTFIRQTSFDLDGTRFRGTYKFTRSGTNRYVRFYDVDGTFMDRYAYQINGSTLHLRLDSTSTWEVMFTEAHDRAAWVLAVKLDWYDEAFDIEPTAFPRTAINPSALPAAARSAYDQLVHDNGANNVDTFKFTLHGSSGYEARTPSTVTLFDSAGSRIATATGADDQFSFAWK